MPPRELILESLLELSAGSSAHTPSELTDRSLHLALLLVGCEAAVLLTSRNRSCTRVVRHRARERSELVGAPRDGTRFTRLLARTDQPFSTADLGSDPRATAEDGCPGVHSGPAVFVPLRFRDKAPGYIALYRPAGQQPFSAAEIRTITLLATCASLAFDNRRLGQDLERLAVTDDLTQVFNYRFLKTALRRELKRATRFHQQLSLVMLDVDNLKSYNDRNGHLRGSYLLKELAGLCAQQVRSFDVLAKYGGDEFTIILPQTPREGAVVVAERVRAAVERHVFALADPGGITVSLGVAAFPEDGNDSMTMLQAADRALYLAKRNGRNRVEVAERLAA
jgi:diguanylate cyclase (GGDEF)-like protein